MAGKNAVLLWTVTVAVATLVGDASAVYAPHTSYTYRYRSHFRTDGTIPGKGGLSAMVRVTNPCGRSASGLVLRVDLLSVEYQVNHDAFGEAGSELQRYPVVVLAGPAGISRVVWHKGETQTSKEIKNSIVRSIVLPQGIVENGGAKGLVEKDGSATNIANYELKGSTGKGLRIVKTMRYLGGQEGVPVSGSTVGVSRAGKVDFEFGFGSVPQFIEAHDQTVIHHGASLGQARGARGETTIFSTARMNLIGHTRTTLSARALKGMCGQPLESRSLDSVVGAASPSLLEEEEGLGDPKVSVEDLKKFYAAVVKIAELFDKRDMFKGMFSNLKDGVENMVTAFGEAVSDDTISNQEAMELINELFTRVLSFDMGDDTAWKETLDIVSDVVSTTHRLLTGSSEDAANGDITTAGGDALLEMEELSLSRTSSRIEGIAPGFAAFIKRIPRETQEKVNNLLEPVHAPLLEMMTKSTVVAEQFQGLLDMGPTDIANKRERIKAWAKEIHARKGENLIELMQMMKIKVEELKISVKAVLKGLNGVFKALTAIMDGWQDKLMDIVATLNMDLFSYRWERSFGAPDAVVLEMSATFGLSIGKDATMVETPVAKDGATHQDDKTIRAKEEALENSGATPLALLQESEMTVGRARAPAGFTHTAIRKSLSRSLHHAIYGQELLQESEGAEKVLGSAFVDVGVDIAGFTDAGRVFGILLAPQVTASRIKGTPPPVLNLLGAEISLDGDSSNLMGSMMAALQEQVMKLLGADEIQRAVTDKVLGLLKDSDMPFTDWIASTVTKDGDKPPNLEELLESIHSLTSSLETALGPLAQAGVPALNESDLEEVRLGTRTITVEQTSSEGLTSLLATFKAASDTSKFLKESVVSIVHPERVPEDAKTIARDVREVASDLGVDEGDVPDVVSDIGDAALSGLADGGTPTDNSDGGSGSAGGKVAAKPHVETPADVPAAEGSDHGDAVMTAKSDTKKPTSPAEAPPKETVDVPAAEGSDHGDAVVTAKSDTKKPTSPAEAPPKETLTPAQPEEKPDGASVKQPVTPEHHADVASPPDVADIGTSKDELADGKPHTKTFEVVTKTIVKRTVTEHEINTLLQMRARSKEEDQADAFLEMYSHVGLASRGIIVDHTAKLRAALKEKIQKGRSALALIRAAPMMADQVKAAVGKFVELGHLEAVLSDVETVANSAFNVLDELDALFESFAAAGSDVKKVFESRPLGKIAASIESVGTALSSLNDHLVPGAETDAIRTGLARSGGLIEKVSRIGALGDRLVLCGFDFSSAILEGVQDVIKANSMTLRLEIIEDVMNSNGECVDFLQDLPIPEGSVKDSMDSFFSFISLVPNVLKEFLGLQSDVSTIVARLNGGQPIDDVWGPAYAKASGVLDRAEQKMHASGFGNGSAMMSGMKFVRRLLGYANIVATKVMAAIAMTTAGGGIGELMLLQTDDDTGDAAVGALESTDPNHPPVVIDCAFGNEPVGHVKREPLFVKSNFDIFHTSVGPVMMYGLTVYLRISITSRLLLEVQKGQCPLATDPAKTYQSVAPVLFAGIETEAKMEVGLPMFKIGCELAMSIIDFELPVQIDIDIANSAAAVMSRPVLNVAKGWIKATAGFLMWNYETMIYDWSGSARALISPCWESNKEKFSPCPNVLREYDPPAVTEPAVRPNINDKCFPCNNEPNKLAGRRMVCPMVVERYKALAGSMGLVYGINNWFDSQWVIGGYRGFRFHDFEVVSVCNEKFSPGPDGNWVYEAYIAISYIDQKYENSFFKIRISDDMAKRKDDQGVDSFKFVKYHTHLYTDSLVRTWSADWRKDTWGAGPLPDSVRDGHNRIVQFYRMAQPAKRRKIRATNVSVFNPTTAIVVGENGRPELAVDSCVENGGWTEGCVHKPAFPTGGCVECNLIQLDESPSGSSRDTLRLLCPVVAFRKPSRVGISETGAAYTNAMGILAHAVHDCLKEHSDVPPVVFNSKLSTSVTTVCDEEYDAGSGKYTAVVGVHLGSKVKYYRLNAEKGGAGGVGVLKKLGYGACSVEDVTQALVHAKSGRDSLIPRLSEAYVEERALHIHAESACSIQTQISEGEREQRAFHGFTAGGVLKDIDTKQRGRIVNDKAKMMATGICILCRWDKKAGSRGLYALSCGDKDNVQNRRMAYHMDTLLKDILKKNLGGVWVEEKPTVGIDSLLTALVTRMTTADAFGAMNPAPATSVGAWGVCDERTWTNKAGAPVVFGGILCNRWGMMRRCFRYAGPYALIQDNIEMLFEANQGEGPSQHPEVLRLAEQIQFEMLGGETADDKSYSYFWDLFLAKQVYSNGPLNHSNNLGVVLPECANPLPGVPS